MKKARWVCLSVLSMLAIASFFSWYGWFSAPNVRRNNDVLVIGSFPRIGNLTLAGSIVAKNEILLTAEFTSYGGRYGKNCTVSFSLNPTLQLVEGKPTWQGDLEAGEKVTLQIRVRCSQDGNYTVRASARSFHPGDVIGLQVQVSVRVRDGAVLSIEKPEGFKPDPRTTNTTRTSPDAAAVLKIACTYGSNMFNMMVSYSGVRAARFL